MKAGRRRKPTALRVIEGNAGHRPLNEREPQPRRDEPPCPTWLDKEAKAEWRRQAPELYAIGVLTAVDGSVLAAYCEAYSLWKRASVRLQKQARNDDKVLYDGILVTTKSGNVILNPLQGACNVARRDMVRLAAELGLTPSSRANLEAANREQDPDGGKYNF